MKVSQLKIALEQTAQMHQETGNVDIAMSLHEFSRLFAGRESMTIESFAKLIGKAMSLPAPGP
jgi:hypothetical protein